MTDSTVSVTRRPGFPAHPREPYESFTRGGQADRAQSGGPDIAGFRHGRPDQTPRPGSGSRAEGVLAMFPDRITSQARMIDGMDLAFHSQTRTPSTPTDPDDGANYVRSRQTLDGSPIHTSHLSEKGRNGLIILVTLMISRITGGKVQD
ncbi:hypothetical protein GCM10023084_25620 [Streptomyces lacrimifluminis]|uniref:Uncharacterized protein n=1 Tax=Streptomyces lacrimifluminis TaxID=1500077 RepID=A0A917NND7_9ACTN|nr:hypothetical protein GCM10012282_07630 [Streptomyces lacrimifluminis]